MNGEKSDDSSRPALLQPRSARGGGAMPYVQTVLLPRMRNRARRPHDLRRMCDRPYARCIQDRARIHGSVDRNSHRRPVDRLARLLLFGLDACPHPFEISRSLIVSAIDLLEEAVNLLRGASLETAVTYLIGAAPLTLGYLFFLTDMNRSPYAFEHRLQYHG